MRIVGVGSPFGADRIGWEVVHRLQAVDPFAGLSAGTVALACEDRPGLRLLEWLEAPGLVVLVDAMQGDGKSGTPPGTLRRFDGLALPADAGFTTTHDFGMMAALELAGALGEVAPEITVFGIEIGDFYPPASEHGPDMDLSAMVTSSGIINNIKELVYNYTKQLQ